MKDVNPFGWSYETLGHDIIEISLLEMENPYSDAFLGEAIFTAHFIEAILPETFNEKHALDINRAYSDRKNALHALFDDSADCESVALSEICKEKKETEETILACGAVFHLLDAMDLYKKGTKETAWFRLVRSKNIISRVMFSLSREESRKQVTALFSRTGAQGGTQAAKNRAAVRDQVKQTIKNKIQKQFTWNDASQTGKSITDRFWSEIKNAIDGGNEWQGISNSDLLQGKIGRQTVYDAVMETAPR